MAKSKPKKLPMSIGGKPVFKNKPGARSSFSTEQLITVKNPRLNAGKPTNIPSFVGGKKLSEAQAVRRAIATGRKSKPFRTIKEAEAAAKRRSRGKPLRQRLRAGVGAGP